MEKFVFSIARKLGDLEHLYLVQLEEVIDCNVTRYKLLHHTEDAIISLKNILRTYLCNWELHFEPHIAKRIDRWMSFSFFEARCKRENQLLDSQVVRLDRNVHSFIGYDNDLPF